MLERFSKLPMRCLIILMTMVSWGLAERCDGQVFRREEDSKRARKAIIIPLHEDINFVSGAMLKRKFQQALDDGAEVIILDINSPGGLTVVTFDLMDMVLDAKDVETVAWVQRDAISGAAMLSLSCDTILIKPDARIGDAGEIVAGPDGAYRYTEAKSRSVLAQKVRDTARATGRPIALAEKMVDKDLIVYRATENETGEETFVTSRELESMEDDDKAQITVGKPIREGGKEVFFTVNGQRAVELGFADATVDSRDAMVAHLNVAEPIPVYAATGMDTFIWVMNSNVVAFLLIAAGLAALLVEMSAPGIGIGGLVSVLCFSLFFWSRFLGGTSGWLEVTLFIVGIAFVLCEIFVLPGFGVFGLTGLVLTLGSLVMASRRTAGKIGSETWIDFGYDLITPLAAFAAFFVAALVLTSCLDSIPGLSRLALAPPTGGSASNGAALGDVSMGDASLGAIDGDSVSAPLWQRVEIGSHAVADSPLRPGGRIQIENDFLDASTQGDFVDAGTAVEIVAKEGSRIIVRAIANG